MATSSEIAHDHDAAHEHPSDAKYVRIALLLAVLTAIEVWLSYAGLGSKLTTTTLLLFAAVKFAIVAMYFMHLKFDNKVLRRLFITGLALAIFCYVAYLSTMQVFP